MKLNIAVVCTPFVFALLTGCAGAPTSQYGQTLGSTAQILQQGSQIAGAAQAMQSVSLTDLLMQRVGVTQAQAQGGAGALFQVAKSQMQASAFSQLSQAVPGMGTLLGAAPALGGGMGGGLSSMMGGSTGSMLGLASAFQQQGMSPSMIQQFIPVVVEYVKGTGGNGLASTLSSALIGQ